MITPFSPTTRTCWTLYPGQPDQITEAIAEHFGSRQIRFSSRKLKPGLPGVQLAVMAFSENSPIALSDIPALCVAGTPIIATPVTSLGECEMEDVPCCDAHAHKRARNTMQSSASPGKSHKHRVCPWWLGYLLLSP